MKTPVCLFVVCLGVGLVGPARAAADDRRTLTQALERSRAIFAQQHLISMVEISPLDEGEETKFRYDRYPETERIQLEGGATYARKKSQGWVESDEWAETGEKVSKDKAEELDAMVSFVDAPLENKIMAKDKTQGGMRAHLVEREAHDNSERLIYELRRENSTGVAYPQFVFDKPKKARDDEALLIGYGGLMYSGEEKVKVNINYSLMILVNATVTSSASEETPPPPAPASEKIYNFTELDEKKSELKGKVVRIEIGPKIIQAQDLGDGTTRVMVKDTSRPTSFYGMVDFPKAGAEKLRTLQAGQKENVTLYLRVSPRAKNEVAQFTVLGTRYDKNADRYAW